MAHPMSVVRETRSVLHPVRALALAVATTLLLGFILFGSPSAAGAAEPAAEPAAALTVRASDENDGGSTTPPSDWSLATTGLESAAWLIVLPMLVLGAALVIDERRRYRASRRR